MALVTGGTRGLGLAIARAFSSAGADVIVASRKEDACREVAAELRSGGGRALGHACHVGRWDDLERLVEAAYGEFGRVDVLVNNAGVSPLYSTLADVTEELFDKVIAVNLKGPFRLVRARRRAHGRGRRRLDHQRLQHRARCARPATSCPTPPRRPASTR